MIQRTRHRANAEASAEINPPSYYTVAPDGEISVDQFASLARDRLTALRELEKVCGYDSPSHQSIKALDAQYSLVDMAMGKLTSLAKPREDALSHAILRLAFCANAESKAWFLRNEERFFAFRLMQFQKLAEPARVDAFYRAN